MAITRGRIPLQKLLRDFFRCNSSSYWRHAITDRVRVGRVQAKPFIPLSSKETLFELKSMEGRLPALDDNSERALSKVQWDTVQEIDSVEQPARWEFSAGPMMPEWPQQNTYFATRSTEHTPNTFGEGGPNRGILNDTWNFSEGALWDVGVWENWDLDLGDLTAPVPDFQGSVTPTNNDSFSQVLSQQPQFAIGLENIDYAAATPRFSSNMGDTLNTSRVGNEKQRAYENPQSIGRQRSNLIIRTPGQASDSLPNSLALGPMQQAQDNSGLSNPNPEPPMVLQSGESTKFQDFFGTASLTSSRQSKIQTPPHPQLKEKRHHKDTERQYRLRLNERYSALLKALPDDLVELASGQSERNEADEALTKIDILALAKSHIASLEKKQSELEEESLVLKGQQLLFKRLFEGLEGS